MSLRVVSVPASELHGARRGGSIILEELCEARGLEPCVGLAECEILTSGQKQELLAERATRIREQEGRATELAGVPAERGSEIRGLRDELAEERAEIVEENRRLGAEIAAAEDRELLAAPGQEGDLKGAGLSLQLDSAWSALRAERLDELDRALDAMEDPAYGTCALCGEPIAIERLRRSPETRVCSACAAEAPAPVPIRTRGAGARSRAAGLARSPGAGRSRPPDTRPGS
jgi:RNA polymerase-binding transcription factor DksA